MKVRWLFVGAALLTLFGWMAIRVWLGSFIHSEAFRHEVETRASQTLGGPVEIRQVDFSIWNGVKLDGLATKLDTAQGTVVASIESVRCSYSLLAMLRGRLQLKGVTLEKPQIVLTQEPASTVPTPRAPPAATGETTTAKQAESGKTSPFQFVLDSAKITDGHLSIRDAAGTPKADLQGVKISARTGGLFGGTAVHGKLRIDNVTLPQGLNLTDFSTPFTYRDGAMEAKPFEATAFKGRLTGDYELGANGPSLLEVNAAGIDVSQIGRSANPTSPSKLAGALALQSKWSGVETGKLTGEGDAQITNGQLKGVGLLNDLATVLRIRELSDPVLQSATTHFRVANGATYFSNLHIDSAVFAMTGAGVIDAQGRLDANMVLTLHSGAMGIIPGTAAALFAHLPGGGGSIPFHIGGTVGNPQANLSTRLFQPSRVEKTIGNTINRFFH